MSIPLIGALVSLGCVVLLYLLFQFEKGRGARIASRMRTRFDHAVSYSEHTISALFSYIGRDVLRQSAHYFFHTLLSFILMIIHGIEHRVQTLLRSNHLLARRSKHRRTVRNKLDEIAEHKAQVALTPEEKRKHKEELLEG